VNIVFNIELQKGRSDDGGGNGNDHPIEYPIIYE